MGNGGYSRLEDRSQALYSSEVTSFEAGHLRFSQEPGLILLRKRKSGASCSECLFCFPCVVVPAVCKILPPYFIAVPDGGYALVERFGAEIQEGEGEDSSLVWSPGLHCFGGPGHYISHMVSKQIILINMPIKECRTLDNVRVDVDVQIAFRITGEHPEMVSKFVHELGPRGLEAQLRAAQQEAVRLLTRRMLHVEVYALANMERPKGWGAPPAAAAGRAGRQNVYLDKATALDHPESMAMKRDDDETKRQSSSNKIHPIHDESGQLGEETKESSVDNEAENAPLLEGVGSQQESQEDTEPPLDEEEAEIDKLLVGGHDAADHARAERGRLRARLALRECLRRLNRQFLPQGVEIADLMVTKVALNPEIAAQMAEKTMAISDQAEKRMNHTVEMQRLGQQEEMTTLQQAQLEERTAEGALGTTDIQKVQKELDTRRAEGMRQQRQIHEEGCIAAKKVLAEAHAEEAKLLIEAEAIRVKFQAKAEQDANIMKAETEKFVQTLIAEAELKVAENEAKAQAEINEAESQISEMLSSKREYSLDLMKIEIYEALAANTQTVITDGSGERVNNMLISEAVLSSHAQDPEKAKAIAEYAVMKNLVDNMVCSKAGGETGLFPADVRKMV